jgi:cytoskeletal protein CcmA (bactofilin family)
MLDNFRRKDAPQSARLQSPYSRLQEALSAAGDEAESAEVFGTESPKADVRAGTESSRSSGATVSKLIVGPDIKLKGAEITDCDTLVVEGRVEASMDSRAIQIAEHGVFVGKAGIDVAEIRGRFEGELTARKQLVIRATGKVSGKVRYGKIAIEEGGELSGDIAALPETKGAGAARAADQGSSPPRLRRLLRRPSECAAAAQQAGMDANGHAAAARQAGRGIPGRGAAAAKQTGSPVALSFGGAVQRGILSCRE